MSLKIMNYFMLMKFFFRSGSFLYSRNFDLRLENVESNWFNELNEG
jgi:hypothetical protein